MAADQYIFNNNKEQDSELGLTSGTPTASKDPEDDPEESKRCIIHPVLVTALANSLTTLTFLLGINLPHLPLLPYPLTGNLLDYFIKPLEVWRNAVIGLLTLWGIHFTRRFAEALFIHQYHRQESLLRFLGALVYHAFFGLWNGWAVNFHLGYLIFNNLMFIMGVLMFVIGEVGNCMAHWKLRSLRTSSRHERLALPRGWLFDYVDCPHYMFEIISWIGFAIASATMAACMFALATIIVVIVLAHRRHKEYLRQFNGKDEKPLYPSSRKALIPCIW